MGAGARLPVGRNDIVHTPLRVGTWSDAVGAGARLPVERDQLRYDR